MVIRLSVNIQIEIVTKDNMLLYDVMGSREAHSGMTTEVVPDVTLQLDQYILREAVRFPLIFQFTLSIGEGIRMSAVSAWLYDKLNGRATKLEIGQTEVQIDKEEITRLLNEKINRSRQ
jgi:hypothetical protein